MTPESNPPSGPADAAHWEAQRHAVALARWVSTGSFGLMVCLWLAIMVSTWSVREAALGRATSSANNLSAAFCEQVYHTLTTISAAMDLTAREFAPIPPVSGWTAGLRNCRRSRIRPCSSSWSTPVAR